MLIDRTRAKWLLVGIAALLCPPARSDEPSDRDRLTNAARQVMTAIVRAAEENASLPTSCQQGAVPPYRRTGDDLAAHYLRIAAAAARRLPRDHVPAFLLAIGISLDDTTFLRDNPLTAGFCRRIESDDERRRRLAILGQPTMRGRRDLCQHFTVSVTLTELVGEKLAEGAGLLKEQVDMQPGGSGFSFADLQADLAGVVFAARLKKGDLTLEAVEKGFLPAAFLPAHDGLREGIDRKTFDSDFGSVADPRLRKELDRLRRVIADLPVYHKSG